MRRKGRAHHADSERCVGLSLAQHRLQLVEQSVGVAVLTLRSPLPLVEVRRRLMDRTVGPLVGSWVEVAGRGPDFFGKVRSDRVRLGRPYKSNRAVTGLVGTLSEGADGGTILTATVR